MYPSREEFSELIYYISELKHQYTNKIDEQSTKINEQSVIIEELLWQIRELSDKIRQLNQWKIQVDQVISDSRKKFNDMTRSCVCRYENHIPKDRLINNRQSMAGGKDKSSVLNNNEPNSPIDDVYEIIEFSDSSQHIYTEPFKIESNYGALRKVGTKSAPSSSKQTYVTNSKRSANSTAVKKGIKKSTRVRNLQKFPAMQDISKSTDSENDSGREQEIDKEKVQLRVKSPTSVTTNSREIASKQMSALVSGTEVEFIRDTRENLESFTRRRDASGILINFDCLNVKSKSEIREKVDH